jgi:hypothetical protein
MMLIGFQPSVLVQIVIVFLFLAAAYFCIHWLPLPTSNGWIGFYAMLVWVFTSTLDYATGIHLEVLVPAFALGCIIKSDHLHGSSEFGAADAGNSAHEPVWQARLDWAIKGGFMLLAGMALPPIQLSGMGIIVVAAHVVFITVISNIGKCLPVMTYRKDAAVRERWALSIGMFPRGEVGIGVLLVSLEIFRQQNLIDSLAVQQTMTVAALSLALNLALTGVFIMAAMRLLRSEARRESRMVAAAGGN